MLDEPMAGVNPALAQSVIRQGEGERRASGGRREGARGRLTGAGLALGTLYRLRPRPGVVTRTCSPEYETSSAGVLRAYERELKRARDIALSEMEAEATTRGADAVITVDLDYETIGNGSELVGSTSGTAVRLAQT
ncbi:MAG TPA: heavy metal-binding domain-containing protein [Acidimicrobiales bacterium]|nr:heavy metal-binding domain-containing protein [Acidimicrobiales bacterium]